MMRSTGSVWVRALVALMAMVTAFAAPAAWAAEDPAGQITIPVSQYDALKRRLADLSDGAPVGVTLSRAELSVDATASQPWVVAKVVVHVLRDSWVQVPLLPAGTAVAEARVDGRPIALSPVEGSLVWTVKGAGERTLTLRYAARRVSASAGGRLEFPTPAAAALALSATLPGVGHEIDLLPRAPFKAQAVGGKTTLTASLPRTPFVTVAWELPGQREWLVTDASYQGEPRAATMAWRARLGLRSLVDGPLRIPVAQSTAAVSRATLDGRAAVVEEHDGQLVVRVQGRGVHVVELAFETPIDKDAGPTSTSVWLPRPPVAAFTVTLPGDKDVTVEPAAGVDVTTTDGATTASFHVPPTHHVKVQWSEALPQDAAAQVRANAEAYHVVKAEEGVLSVTTYLLIGVTRGATNQLVMTVPADVVVNAVRGEGVSDWRVLAADGARRLVVYLDRDITADARIEVDSELLVDKDAAAADPLAVPFVVPQDVHRQRGMVALIHGTELQMKPAVASEMSAVGENQLPHWLKDKVSGAVTHTYKFVDPAAGLTVRLVPFERKLARFDAQLDSLLSLADGVVKAVATVRIQVKAGSLTELSFPLPEGINVLSANAPSLREHRVVEPSAGEPGPRILELNFTREVEGAIKLEIAYERVLSPGDHELPVPLLRVTGASIEQGRVGIEALTAVEVKALSTERLLPMDVQELPRQLVLRTTNPILLAFKYVHADPAPSLVLSVKRHTEVAVQVAAIDAADYETLYTQDGVILTRARYTVRNRGKQFLELKLPKGAEIWSASLGGQAVKPARAEADDTVLVPLLNTSEPFVAELVYVQRTEALGFSGVVRGELPLPDIVETRTTWRAYLPADVSYGPVATNMTIIRRPDQTVVQAGGDASIAGFNEDGSGRAAQAGVLPLRIQVPKRGRELVLTKLLANQSSDRPAFEIRYSGSGAGVFGALLVFLGGIIFGLVLLGWLSRTPPNPRVAVPVAVGGAVAVGIGALVLGASVGWLGASAGVVVLVVGARWVARKHREATGGAAVPDAEEPVG